VAAPNEISRESVVILGRLRGSDPGQASDGSVAEASRPGLTLHFRWTVDGRALSVSYSEVPEFLAARPPADPRTLHDAEVFAAISRVVSDHRTLREPGTST